MTVHRGETEEMRMELTRWEIRRYIKKPQWVDTFGELEFTTGQSAGHVSNNQRAT